MVKPKGQKGRRSVWWWVHHWLGLKLALFMTFVLLTGTLATVAHEIDWLADPAIRVMPRDEAQASWGAWAAAVQAAAPEAEIEALNRPLEPWFAASAVLRMPDDSRRIAYVNPWTAEVQGVSTWFNAHRFLRFTHRHLMLPVKWGLPIVCSMALVLLASLVTGLIAYKKFWRGFFRLPRWHAGRKGEARRFTGDLHRFAGLWSIWFLVLIIATSVWYLVEWGGGQAPPQPRPEVVTGPAQPVGAELDALIATARAADPELRITGVRFPGEKGRGVIVEGQARAVLVRERTNTVQIDPRDGAVLLTTRGEDLNLHQRISEMADPLHFGTFGGLLTRLIWFVFGAVMTGLSVTGVMIYALRMKRAEDEAAIGTAPWLWRSLGPAAYPSAALILLSLALTPMVAAGFGLG
ncbi:PepSY-associated TM helix domain-containing protein [Brevundimonas balnearis]|uniref:PepSY-associated TM helix domain-containing protein n=1 Tax=Brevundimonas balnearis TaxID=1572858 RepID=A0ABV6R3U1_9CAUL